MTANWPEYLIYSSDNPPAIIVKQTENNLVMSLTDSWQWHSAFTMHRRPPQMAWAAEL